MTSFSLLTLHLILKPRHRHPSFKGLPRLWLLILQIDVPVLFVFQLNSEKYPIQILFGLFVLDVLNHFKNWKEQRIRDVSQMLVQGILLPHTVIKIPSRQEPKSIVVAHLDESLEEFEQHDKNEFVGEVRLQHCHQLGLYDKVAGSNWLGQINFLDEFNVLFDVILIVTVFTALRNEWIEQVR